MPFDIQPVGIYSPNYVRNDEYYIDTIYEQTWVGPPFVGPTPWESTCKLVLEEDINAGETLFVIALFSRSQSTRATFDMPNGVDIRDPSHNIWNNDRDPTITGRPGGVNTVLELWRATIVHGTELLAGQEIEIAGCYHARAWKANKPIGYQAYRRVNPPNSILGDFHNHNIVPPGEIDDPAHSIYPSSLYRYTLDQLNDLVPDVVIGYGHAANGSGFSFLTPYVWPQNVFILDEPAGINQAGEPQNTLTVNINQHSSIGGPVTSTSQQHNWWTIVFGWYKFVTTDWRHVRGIESGWPIPDASYPGYDPHGQAYHYTHILADECFYSVPPDLKGLDIVELESGNQLVRCSNQSGIIVLEKSKDAGATWPDEYRKVLTTLPEDDALPTLMWAPGDRVFCWFHDNAGNAQCFLSEDYGRTWNLHATFAAELSTTGGWKFPRSVYLKGKCILFLHSRATNLYVYTSPDYFHENDLAATFTMPVQLVAAESDQRGYVNVLAIPSTNGPIDFRRSHNGKSWGNPVAIGATSTLPSYALGRRLGVATWYEGGVLKAAVIDEDHYTVRRYFTPPPVAWDTGQQFALLATHDDKWYWLGWINGVIGIYFSDNLGRTWSIPV